jgi:hypothetical protein
VLLPLGPGSEAEGSWSRMGDSHWVSQATGCLFAHTPVWTSRQSLSAPAVDVGHSELGTRLLLRQGTTRTHDTGLYLLDGIGLGTM